MEEQEQWRKVECWDYEAAGADAMTPEEFIRRYEADWLWLESAVAPRPRKAGPLPDIADFPARFRRVCQQLEIARERHYPIAIIERLNALVQAGQGRLYGPRGGTLAVVMAFIVHEFPREVRREAAAFWLACALFVLPLAGSAWLAAQSPEFAHAAVGPAQLEQMDEMYGPGQKRLGRDRNAEDDVMMFGFYIFNNVKIGFRTFAGGLLFGLGTAFFLVFNAVHIGTVAGYMATTPNAERFFSFVVGHGSFELTAIVLAGMAGLMLGRGLAFPGALTRAAALRAEAARAVRIVCGMALFLVAAAVLEAFWSSSTQLPPAVKYGVGVVLWTSVFAYLGFAGRGHGR